MTDAEILLLIANKIESNHAELCVIPEADGLLCELTALALRLRRRPDVMLKALVEEWSRYRIIRELY